MSKKNRERKQRQKRDKNAMSVYGNAMVAHLNAILPLYQRNIIPIALANEICVEAVSRNLRALIEGSDLSPQRAFEVITSSIFHNFSEKEKEDLAIIFAFSQPTE